MIVTSDTLEQKVTLFSFFLSNLSLCLYSDQPAAPFLFLIWLLAWFVVPMDRGGRLFLFFFFLIGRICVLPELEWGIALCMQIALLAFFHFLSRVNLNFSLSRTLSIFSIFNGFCDRMPLHKIYICILEFLLPLVLIMALNALLAWLGVPLFLPPTTTFAYNGENGYGDDSGIFESPQHSAVDPGPSRAQEAQPILPEGKGCSDSAGATSSSTLHSLNESELNYLRKLHGTLDGVEVDQPTRVMEQAGPSEIAPQVPSSTGLGPAEQQAYDLKQEQNKVDKELLDFIRDHTQIEPKYNFVMQLSENLQIQNADLHKLQKIEEVMDTLKQCNIANGREAAKHLKASIREWEKNGRP